MSDYLYSHGKFIPEISDDEIQEMLAIMKPAIILEEGPRNGWLVEIDITGVDLRNQSYIWDTKRIGEPFLSDQLDSLKIPTFHSYGAPSFFKPSLAETLGCIRHYCDAWQRVKYFALYSNLDSTNVFGQYHSTKCLLVAKALVVEGGGTSGKLIDKT
jgi:hypothetical protein